MPTEKTDVVIVGTGAAGGILAAELAKAGMRVIALERGPRLKTSDFDARDELRFFQRQELRPDPKSQPITWRRNASERATPLGTLNYGNQAGGGTVHYGAVSWRFHEDDFRARSQTTERYGEAAIPADSSLTDWPLGYADLEPYYDQAEYELGVSGKAGNLQGTIVDGGNVFEAPRRREYPLPPLLVEQPGIVLTKPRVASAIIRSRHRARFSRNPTRGDPAVPIVAFAKRSAAIWVRSPRFWSRNFRKPMRRGISSSSPELWPTM